MSLLNITYLGLNAWTDWKKKEIDLRYTIVFVLGTAVFNLWMGTGQNWTGILPGGLLWFLSRRKRESIGNGDGAVVMGLGWAIGLEKIWSVLMGGFLLAGCLGVILLITGRKKTLEIPFIPFLFVSFLLGEWGK